MVCVTGVSGSGKSSLINEILYKAVAAEMYGSKEKPGKYKKIKGLRAHRQDHRHQPGAYRQDAAFQSGDVYGRVHTYSGSVLAASGGKAARIRQGPVQLQRKRRHGAKHAAGTAS